MPTWAADIIFTSLAPSPIASVTLLCVLSLINVTTYYFCLGETLQHRTTEHLEDILMICCYKSFIIAKIRAYPVKIKALDSDWLFSFNKYKVSINYFSTYFF
jgi:hypothetical protein